MSKINMKTCIADSYKLDLELLRASKIQDDMERDHLINILTLTAYEDISCSQAIVDVIRNQMKVVSAQSKILIVALVFAIVTSVGMEYKILFDKYIIEIFMDAFVCSDSAGRWKLFEMRDKWDIYFSKKSLHELDCAAKKIDRNWPIIRKRPERFEMNEENMTKRAEIQQLNEKKRILLAEIEKLEREAVEDSQNQMEKLKIIKQNPRKKPRQDQIAEFKSKWNEYQPSVPFDVKIDFSMDSQEDPFSSMFTPAAKKFSKSAQISGIITPPPENDLAGKPTNDNESFWAKTQLLTGNSPSLFVENSSEFVI